MRSFVTVLAAAAALAVTSFASSANAAFLSDLLAPGASFEVSSPDNQVGTLVFSNFVYNKGPSSLMPDAGSITVSPTITYGEDGSEYLGFGLFGPFHDYAGGDAADFTLTYTVTTKSGNATISDAHLAIAARQGDLPFPIAGGFGRITVDELWVPTNGTQAQGGFLNVDNSVPVQQQYADSAKFETPVTGLNVTKDVMVDAGPLGFADFSIIYQTFSQTPGSGDTPEPMTLSIFGLGAAGLLFRRSRKA